MKDLCLSSRNAEFHSAVSPISNRQTASSCASAPVAEGSDGAPRRPHVPSQSETLRYGRVKLRATARASESGVALVITLILLSVITFMAIAFLVLSRGQKSSTTTTTDQRIATDMANGALARAEAELVAPVLALTNAFNYGMLVSTNYSLDGGFSNTAPASFYSS